MTCREFAGWMAYSNIEPFGELRADWRSANEAAIIARAFGSDIEPEDCVLKFADKEEPEGI